MRFVEMFRVERIFEHENADDDEHDSDNNMGLQIRAASSV